MMSDESAKSPTIDTAQCVQKEVRTGWKSLKSVVVCGRLLHPALSLAVWVVDVNRAHQTRHSLRSEVSLQSLRKCMVISPPLNSSEIEI
jgi:hypothetical protein